MARDGIHHRMRHWLGRWSAHWTLALLGVALTVFGYRSYCAVQHELTAAALSGRTAISELAASTLTQDFQRWMDVGRALASRVRFGQLIQAGRWEEAGQIMAGVSRAFPGVEQVLVSDAAGTLQAAIPAPEPGSMLSGIAFTERPFVSDVQGAAGSADRTFLVGVPVMTVEGQPLAMLTLRIDTERFGDLFAQLRLEPRATLQVVDRRGRLAFDTAQAQASTDLSGEDIVQRMLAGRAGIETDQAAEEVVAFAPTAFGWGVLARWPHPVVFAARDAQLQRVLYTCALLAVMLAVAFGLLLRLAVERRQTHSERRTKVELESRVRERTAQLEKANVDLESFSYSVSHDLRAPLRAIDGYVHFLFDEHQEMLGANGRRCIDSIHRNVQHMSRLIDELLELARVGRIALKQEQVDMQALVDEVLAAVLGARNDVVVQVEALPPVHADVTLIRQIWVNLLDNAVKYSSRTEFPQITVRAEVEAAQVTYCVVDNGVGFNMQHYERLFKPFSRLHGAGEFGGTGVGLALVKRIVERHDGRVWAESIPNQSTKVFFSLPNPA